MASPAGEASNQPLFDASRDSLVPELTAVASENQPELAGDVPCEQEQRHGQNETDMHSCIIHHFHLRYKFVDNLGLLAVF